MFAFFYILFKVCVSVHEEYNLEKEKKSKQLLNLYWIPGTVLSAFYILPLPVHLQSSFGWLAGCRLDLEL